MIRLFPSFTYNIFLLLIIFTIQETIANTNLNKKIMSKPSSIKVIFSDVDGTLVHYPDHTIEPELELDSETVLSESEEKNDELVYLPASSTGMKGIISRRTFDLCDTIRSSHNRKIVLVSGMRTTTLQARVPFLPRADAYASENGGRIFYPLTVVSTDNNTSTLTDKNTESTSIEDSVFYDKDGTAFQLKEDLEWRNEMDTTELYNLAKELEDDGWVLDKKGYSTCFRVHRKKQTTKQEQFNELSNIIISRKIEGIACTTNLGCVDFYPRVSGKKNCCEYLANKFLSKSSTSNFLSEHCVCMCDDDNDLEMAMACGHAYIPGISSESMEKTIEANRDHFTVTYDSEEKREGVFATEYALDLILGNITSEEIEIDEAN